MIVYTSHVKPGALPVLVREGFSWGAAIFGWIWLLLAGAWIPAVLVFIGALAALQLATMIGAPAVLLALFLAQGMFGHDLLRWSLALKGYRSAGPVAGATHDAALLRLLDERPDLRAGLPA